jgi:hypothetical protein
MPKVHTRSLRERRTQVRMIVECEKRAMLPNVIPNLIHTVRITKLRAQLHHILAENANVELASERLCRNDSPSIVVLWQGQSCRHQSCHARRVI